MKRATTNIWVWVILGLVLVGGLALAGAARVGLFAVIGDPIGYTPMTVYVYEKTASGYTSYGKSWSALNYQNCTADYPTYFVAPANKFVDKYGNVYDSYDEGTWLMGNRYRFPKTVYVKSTGNNGFTESAPRQDPGCVQAITAFAQSAGVNITLVQYVNQTVTEVVVNEVTKYKCSDGYVADTIAGCVGHDKVERIYTNQTIYICAGSGTPVSDPADCETSAPAVPVTHERTAWRAFVDWLADLFR